MSRRPNGTGAVQRFHAAKYGCPDVVVVEGRKVRPDHKCSAPYRGSLWVTTPSGRVRKQVYGRTQKAVEGQLRKLSAEDLHGTVVAKSMTVGKWLDRWYANNVADWKVNTRKSYRSKIKRWLKPYVGHHRLDSLQPVHIQDLFRAMKKAGVSETTRRQTWVILHAALRAAMENQLVHRNVTEIGKRPSSLTNPRRPLSVSMAWAVLRVAGDNPRWWVALMMGVRQGECLALRWSRMNLKEGWLEIDRALSRNTDDSEGIPKGLVLDTPKSRQSNRRIPIPPMVVDRLKAHRKAHMGERHVVRIYDIPSGEYVEVDDFLFTNAAGGPVDLMTDYRGWKKLLHDAGVPYSPPHTARNTAAALLEDAGVAPRVIAEILGHTDVKVTYRYQEGNEDAKVRAMGDLDAYMRRKGKGA